MRAMGIYTRGQRLWVSYKDAAGKWVSKRTPYLVGDEAKAERFHAALVREIEHRRSVGLTGPATVASYAKVWIAERKARKLRSARDDESRLALHVIPALGDRHLAELRPRDVRQLILDLRARDELAPRTIRHVYAALRAMCRSAVVNDMIAATPCVLEPGILPGRIDRDPEWRASAVFTRAEVERILSADAIPADRRTLYGLLFLAGLRFGEASALRWRHYERDLAPLGRLTVATSYDVKTKQVGATKTHVARAVPVHPTLAAMLAEWRLGGFVELFGRRPGDDELLVPSRRGACRSVNHGLKRFHQDLDALGIGKRRQHDARRTFISLAQADGARRDLLEWVTHGPRGDIMSAYTSIPWGALCDEVAKLRIERLGGVVLGMERRR